MFWDSSPLREIIARKAKSRKVLSLIKEKVMKVSLFRVLFNMNLSNHFDL
jgi:hypothetical protein